MGYSIKSCAAGLAGNTFLQGGTCVGGNESIGTYNAFPVAFSSFVTVIPYGYAGNYINYLNLREKTLAGFSITGSENARWRNNVPGMFVAFGR